MSIDDLPADLIELRRQISQLPVECRGGVTEALSYVEQAAVRRKRILTLLQDAFNQLRLDMQYIMLDLEATKRERDHALGK